MTQSSGNTRLKAARQHAGYASQQAFANALTQAAPRIGLGPMEVSVRQIRAGNRRAPPWPRADHQRLLVHVLQLPIEQLGFTPPWQSTEPAAGQAAAAGRDTSNPLSRPAFRCLRPTAAVQPPTIGADYSTITVAHRRLYWSVQPAHLHPTVAEHTRLGLHLLAETTGVARRLLATALAESLLLAGRIEFFDLRQPDEADATYVRALQAAGEADDPLLGAAILAHAAFIPGWAQRRDEAAERMRAARTYARRGPASAEFLAWLDAVEAECETRCGHPKDALRAHRARRGHPRHRQRAPLAGVVHLVLPGSAGRVQGQHPAQGRPPRPGPRRPSPRPWTALPADEGKQRTVILGDLAAVEAAQQHPEEACAHAEAGARPARRSPGTPPAWNASAKSAKPSSRGPTRECVRHLDDRLYGWQTTLSALRR